MNWPSLPDRLFINCIFFSSSWNLFRQPTTGYFPSVWSIVLWPFRLATMFTRSSFRSGRQSSRIRVFVTLHWGIVSSHLVSVWKSLQKVKWGQWENCLANGYTTVFLAYWQDVTWLHSGLLIDLSSHNYPLSSWRWYITLHSVFLLPLDKNYQEYTDETSGFLPIHYVSWNLVIYTIFFWG